MGILDDAIREHLDLKRKHGAGGAELESIENEAFGTGDRPDPFAAGELFGETATAPQGEAAETGSEEIPGPATPPPGPSEDPTRVVPASDPEAGPPSGEPLEPSGGGQPTASASPELEEPLSPPPPPGAEPPASGESASLEELMAEDDSGEDLEGLQAAPPPPPPPDTAEAARPGGEEAIPPPPEPEEPEPELPPRELIAEPEAEEEEEPVAEAEVEEEIEADAEEIEADAEVEVEDPDAVPPPPPPPPEGGPEPPGRARGRVNVPTQEFSPPPAGTDERDALDDALVEEAPESDQAGEEEAPGEGQSALYDFATDEEPFAGDGDDFEALGPVTDEPAEDVQDEEDVHDDTGEFDPNYVRDPDSEEFDAPAPVPETGEHDAQDDDGDDAVEEGDDILAGSPDFVEDGEDEDLWFEKGPPKDFDFEGEDEEK